MLRTICVALATFAPAILALADEVHLADGSKIVGTVTRITSGSDGKITVKTDFAGDLTFPTAKVKGITTNDVANIQLDTGDKVVAKLQYDAATGAQTVQGEVVGSKPVTVAQVASAWPKGEEDPAVVAQRAKWKARIDIGITGQSGNSEVLNVNGGIVLKREAPADRLMLYLTGRYSKDNGERTTNEIIGGALWECDITDRLFWFIRGELEHDEFEKLDLRATVTTGLGYFLIREKETELKIRGGIGYQHESFDDGTNEDKVIAEAGVDFRKDISPWVQYVHSTTVYPSLEDISDVRVVMVNAVEIPLVSDKSWKLKIGVKHEYDAEPESGVDRLDTFYFANIGVDF